MLNHYTRHAGDPEQTKYRYANQDIDQTRTHLNYAIFARDDPAAFVQSKIDEVGDDLQRESARLESLRQGTRAAERDVEELRPIASIADRFDHADRFEKRGILDSIAARCDGLRGRVEQVVEGIRGAVGRLEVAIEDLARKLAPRSARMTTRALKRDLAALEKDMSPVTLASEARDAARASNARRGNVPQRDRGQSR